MKKTILISLISLASCCCFAGISEANDGKNFKVALRNEVVNSVKDEAELEQTFVKIKNYEMANNARVVSAEEYNHFQNEIIKLENAKSSVLSAEDLNSLNEKIAFIKTKIVKFDQIKGQLNLK